MLGISNISSLIFKNTQRLFSTTPRVSQFWDHLNQAPLDGNHATNAAFNADQSPNKVNLGRGVYKTDEGKNWILPCVQEAENRIASSLLGHEYLPFSGLKEFTDASARFAFSEESELIEQERVATVQTISGTGALRIGAEFLSRFLPEAPVFLPNPTYVNHYPVFRLNGFELRHYRYYDPETCGLDFDGFIEDVKQAPRRSIFLFHACAHNPTGVDPSAEQWREISSVALERGHLCFFDCAYQGFASGDSHVDGQSFRQFIADGHHILLAQSYAKNFGLYGQRVGALNVVARNKDQRDRVLSNLNSVIRPMYSNPPLHGARIVARVFNDQDLRQQWNKDVRTMADRLNGVRAQLVDLLHNKHKSNRDFSHISKQIGMFAYSGLSKEEVEALRSHHIYMNYDGRMSVSGINSSNVEYLANAMHQVTQ